VTVEGLCIDVDGRTTRLLLYVDGALMADAYDVGPESSDGLIGSLMVAGDTAALTVAFSHYEERDQSAAPADTAAPASS
jgi:hypothetical protein